MLVIVPSVPSWDSSSLFVAFDEVLCSLMTAPPEASKCNVVAGLEMPIPTPVESIITLSVPPVSKRILSSSELSSTCIFVSLSASDKESELIEDRAVVTKAVVAILVVLFPAD